MPQLMLVKNMEHLCKYFCISIKHKHIICNLLAELYKSILKILKMMLYWHKPSCSVILLTLIICCSAHFNRVEYKKLQRQFVSDFRQHVCIHSSFE